MPGHDRECHQRQSVPWSGPPAPSPLGRCQDEQLALRDLITASPCRHSMCWRGSNCAVPPAQAHPHPGYSRPWQADADPRQHSPITGQTAILSPSAIRRSHPAGWSWTASHLRCLAGQSGRDNLFFLPRGPRASTNGRTLPGQPAWKEGAGLQQSEPTAHPYRPVALQRLQGSAGVCLGVQTRRAAACRPCAGAVAGAAHLLSEGAQRSPHELARAMAAGVHPICNP